MSKMKLPKIKVRKTRSKTSMVHRDRTKYRRKSKHKKKTPAIMRGYFREESNELCNSYDSCFYFSDLASFIGYMRF